MPIVRWGEMFVVSGDRWVGQGMIRIRVARPVTRVLQVGDLHLQSRELADQVPVLSWLAAQVLEREVGLVIVAGDLAGLACPHLSRPAERQALLGFVLACRGAGAQVWTWRTGMMATRPRCTAPRASATPPSWSS